MKRLLFNVQEPIAVANFVIETAKKNHLDVTNFQLQKILFFTQGLFLDDYGIPLFNGTFLRWQYGPYEKNAYSAFRDMGSVPITSKSLDIYVDDDGYFQVGDAKEIHLDSKYQDLLEKMTLGLLRIPVWKLNDIALKDESFTKYKELTNDYKAPNYTNREIVECFRRNKSKIMHEINELKPLPKGKYVVKANSYEHKVTLSYVKNDKYNVYEYDNGTIVLIPIKD